MSEEEVLGKDTRTIFAIGRSLAVTLPKEFVEVHNLKPGDRVDIYFNDVVHIEPVKTEKIRLKLKKSKK